MLWHFLNLILHLSGISWATPALYWWNNFSHTFSYMLRLASKPGQVESHKVFKNFHKVLPTHRCAISEECPWLQDPGWLAELYPAQSCSRLLGTWWVGCLPFRRLSRGSSRHFLNICVSCLLLCNKLWQA